MYVVYLFGMYVMYVVYLTGIPQMSGIFDLPFFHTFLTRTTTYLVLVVPGMYRYVLFMRGVRFRFNLRATRERPTSIIIRTLLTHFYGELLYYRRSLTATINRDIYLFFCCRMHCLLY